MDERGSEVLIKDGVLKIRDREQRLLAKVKRSQNRLYLLDLKVKRSRKPVITKLEDRSTPMVLLGYEEGTKANRLYDPRGGKVVVSHNIVFDEKAA